MYLVAVQYQYAADLRRRPICAAVQPELYRSGAVCGRQSQSCIGGIYEE